jgi:two-component system, OmpR family, phosphate regulon sensor histidine kinase PhoR
LKTINLSKKAAKGKAGGSKEMDEKEQFFDLLIHDLTGPLAVVSTSTANLLHKEVRYGPLTDQQRRVLERILRNAHKAQILLQEMLEIARSEEGLFQKELFPIEKPLRESFIDALEMADPHLVEKLCRVEDHKRFETILRTHGIVVEITGRYCQSPFCHDQRKVQQILRNLVSNALKYRRERTTVCISGEMELIISVEDDGLGVPPGEEEAIFNRFVRLKDQRRPDVPGHGLGLSGVKALVEAMKGEIKLVRPEGGGTCFVVRIPPLPSK